jgi:UDP-GlcNAc:undecaprenyl-phosphate GlcNAc-1-phosphate transferase
MILLHPNLSSGIARTSGGLLAKRGDDGNRCEWGDRLSLMGWNAAAGALALVVSWLVGSNADRIGRLLGLLDFPDPAGGRKRHDNITPLVGGLAVALSALGGVAIVYMWSGASDYVASHLAWFAFAISSMYIIGLTDDRFALGPKIRLALAFIVLLLVVLYAHDFSLPFLRFSWVDEVWFLGDGGYAFALLALVGLLNAVNMADGKNGLVIGICLIWAGTLLVQAPAQLMPILVAVIAALAVTMKFNMAGRLFLGDGGSYVLSGIFGLLSIYIYNHEFAAVRADHIAVLFAVPVFDTIRLMTVRAARGTSPFAGDRDHLHHHLAYRWGWPRGLYIYLALVAVPNLLAIALPEFAWLWLLVALGAYAAVMAFAMRGERIAV